MRTLLTLAGFDPSSGAGITADLAVFAAHGFFGTSAITALTVQSTLGVKRVQATDPELLAETLDWLCADVPPVGIKVGMLANAANVLAVAEFLERLREQQRVAVVLDPVLRASSGRELLDAAGLALLQDRLLRVVDWVTPNVAELGALAGEPVDTEMEVRRAVAAVRARCAGLAVAATGGDLDACDRIQLADGREELLVGERIESAATHGTGCAFSSALLCGLASGLDGLEAARRAKSYVAEAIRRAAPQGRGKGPLNLLWPLQSMDERRWR